MDTLLLILVAIVGIDGIVYFFLGDEQGLSADISILALVTFIKSWYVTLPSNLGGVYTLWGIRAFCLVAFIIFLIRSYGVRLRMVARDSDGNVILDEEGHPLTGRKAREFVKNHKKKVCVQLHDIDGNPVDEEVQKKVDDYFSTFLKEDGSLKEKDEEGNEITEEYLNDKLRKFIAEEFERPSMSDNEFMQGFEDFVKNVNETKNIDLIRTLSTDDFVNVIMESFDPKRCEACPEWCECQKLSEEEFKKNRHDCLVEMLDSTLLETMESQMENSKEEEE